MAKKEKEEVEEPTTPEAKPEEKPEVEPEEKTVEKKVEKKPRKAKKKIIGWEIDQNRSPRDKIKSGENQSWASPDPKVPPTIKPHEYSGQAQKRIKISSPHGRFSMSDKRNKKQAGTQASFKDNGYQKNQAYSSLPQETQKACCPAFGFFRKTREVDFCKKGIYKRNSSKKNGRKKK